LSFSSSDNSFMRLRKPSEMTQLIDTAQRLRIVREAQREFLRNWAAEKSIAAQRFHRADRIQFEGLSLQFRRIFDDE
jgi:hypothetical protein